MTVKQKADVVIIGGGLMGSSLAYYLSKIGKKVFLIEKKTINFEASGRNAGAVRQQAREPVLLELAMKSIEMWLHLQEELGEDLEYRRCGSINIAVTEQDMKLLENRLRVEKEAGLRELMLLRRDQVQEIAPCLSEIVIGATYCPIDGIANPMKVAPAYARAAKRFGAEIRIETEAKDIVLKGGSVSSVITSNEEIQTPIVVISAGPWSPEIGRMIGVDIPIEAHRSQILVTEKLPPIINPFIRFPNTLKGYVTQRPIGNVIIGCERIPKQCFDKTSTLSAFSDTSKKITQLIPCLRKTNIIRKIGAQLNLHCEKPIIGWMKNTGLAIAAGLSGAGFALGPILAN